jgi:hypothetical protein
MHWAGAACMSKCVPHTRRTSPCAATLSCNGIATLSFRWFMRPVVRSLPDCVAFHRHGWFNCACALEVRCVCVFLRLYSLWQHQLQNWSTRCLHERIEYESCTPPAVSRSWHCTFVAVVAHDSCHAKRKCCADSVHGMHHSQLVYTHVCMCCAACPLLAHMLLQLAVKQYYCFALNFRAARRRLSPCCAVANASCGTALSVKDLQCLQPVT